MREVPSARTPRGGRREVGGAVLGVQTGAAVIVAIYIANVVIKGRAPKWTS